MYHPKGHNSQPPVSSLPLFQGMGSGRPKVKLAVEVDKLRGRLELIPHLQPTPFAVEMNLTPAVIQTVVERLLTDLEKSVQSTPEGPQKFATILSDMNTQLVAMDRYERRALSRRKFAVRAFDAAGRQAASACE
jgi:hypothetical protein